VPLEIISSTLNLSPPAAALWTAEQHRDYLRQTGYVGTTYYPLDNVLAAQIATGVEVGDFIAAFQQPWRERTRLQVMGNLIKKTLTQPSQAKDAGFDAAMNMAMPHIDRGLKVLNRVQHRLGTESLRPVVVHPQGQMFGDSLADGTRKPNKRRDYHDERSRYALGEFQWQPTVEFAYNRGVLTTNPDTLVDDMSEIATADGLGRAAFDVNHVFATRQGKRFSNPEAMAARFASIGMLGSFEFSLQPHLGGDIADLTQIANGNIAGTPHGRALAAAAGNTAAGDTFTLRVEIPDYAWDLIGQTDHVQAHRDLVTALGEYTTGFLAV
jgi:hypothetical protein